MANQTNVVIFDSAARKHVPLAVGDKVDKSVIDWTATTAAFNSGTGVLSITHPDGSISSVNLGSLAADKFLNGASYNNTTATLTLSMSDGSTFAIPLGDLVAINVANTGNVKFTGTGTSAAALTANLDLASAGGPPTTTDDGTTPTVFFGGNSSALGTPLGWATVVVGGVTVKMPYYTN